MKKNILTGWTLRRSVYLIAGILIAMQAIREKEWMLTLAGIYFAAMGLFAFGCASGNCLGGKCTAEKRLENTPVPVRIQTQPEKNK